MEATVASMSLYALSYDFFILDSFLLTATNSFSNGVKNGKIVKSVNDGRQKVVDDSESVVDNY